MPPAGQRPYLRPAGAASDRRLPTAGGPGAICRAAAVAAACAGCSDEPSPRGDPPADPTIRAAPEPAPSPVAAPPPPSEATALDASLADRYPSLVYYPEVGAGLQNALRDGAAPREILSALSETMAPYRWPTASDWDRAGFIDMDAATPGFVTRTWGKSVSQPTDRHDLGCTGGFIEAVRLLLLPRLALADIERCDPDTFSIEGGPRRCDPEHDFGRLAIANIAARLQPGQLAGGRRFVELVPTEPAARAELAVPGAMHLCTVSHQSGARGGERFHHHMVIALGEPDALWIFDTTGVRGVAIEAMSDERFVRYFTRLLGSNREYRYVPRSARLTCLAVRPA